MILEEHMNIWVDWCTIRSYARILLGQTPYALVSCQEEIIAYEPISHSSNIKALQ